MPSLHFRTRLSAILVAGCVLAVATLGVIVLDVSHAASSSVSLEAENGGLSGAALGVSDGSSSGGGSVMFGYQKLVNQKWPDSRVWSHVVGQLPNYSNISGTGADDYGDLYPLDLVQGDYTAVARTTSGVPRALQAGVTGVQIMEFDDSDGTNFVLDWMRQADPTWSDSDPNNNFMVAPDISASEDNTVRIIQAYAAAAASHPSAARIEGKLIIFTYGTRSLTPAQWTDARSRLGSLNNSLYFIADAQTDSSQVVGGGLNPDWVTPYFPIFEASYDFEDQVDRIWNSLVTLLNQNNRQYVGGGMPGYDRETCATCGYVDAEGTSRYRRIWDLSLASGSKWQNIITWNDMVERTDVQASSNWNKTRADITAFYSAKLRGLAFPKPDAELYITTPQMVQLGSAVAAEGLVLNGSAKMVTVTTQLIDKDGNAVGGTSGQDVAPGTANAATTPATSLLTVMPAGRFLRAKTTSFDKVSGVQLQQVISAPIVVYPTGAQPSPNLQRLYYSIPAYASLPAKPTLSLAASPVANDGTTATVSAPAGTQVRFSEVLQNTRQVANGFTSSAFAVHVPMASRTIIGGQVTSAAADGFYVGRVIDEQERVGYSDPVYVAAP